MKRHLDLESLKARVTAALVGERTGSGVEIQIRCPHPHHLDEDPSASWNVEDGLWHCHSSRCGRGGGTVEIARYLGLINERGADRSRRRSRRRRSSMQTAPRPPKRMPPGDARHLWDACSSDPGSDPAAASYLKARGLLAALSTGQVRLVPDNPSLPAGSHTWRRRGYAVAAALYELDGRLASVQARRIDAREPKSMNARGATKGLVFATPAGRDVLRGRDATSPVILAEGLTDTAALSFVTDAPVIGCAGAGYAKDAIGAWCANRTVLIALDVDESSERVVKPVADKIAALGGRPRRITWPDEKKDACKALVAVGEGGLRAYLAHVCREADQ